MLGLLSPAGLFSPGRGEGSGTLLWELCGMLGSHTVQQQLRVCLKAAKQAVLIPALVVPERLGIPLPIFVDGDQCKKVEAGFWIHVDVVPQNIG